MTASGSDPLPPGLEDRLWARREERLAPGRILSYEAALAFLASRGLVALWPLARALVPSLWTARAGLRPVAEDHQDPGHETWFWKDRILSEGNFYYGKAIRGKGFFLREDLLLALYRLQGLSDPEAAYGRGLLPLEALLLYRVLDRPGTLPELSARTGLAPKAVERGLALLQGRFLALPVGVASVGRWRYGYRYARFAHRFPEVPEKAWELDPWEACRKLLLAHLNNVGGAWIGELAFLFPFCRRALEALAREGEVVAWREGFYLLPGLVE